MAMFLGLFSFVILMSKYCLPRPRGFAWCIRRNRDCSGRLYGGSALRGSSLRWPFLLPRYVTIAPPPAQKQPARETRKTALHPVDLSWPFALTRPKKNCTHMHTRPVTHVTAALRNVTGREQQDKPTPRPRVVERENNDCGTHKADTNNATRAERITLHDTYIHPQANSTQRKWWE